MQCNLCEWRCELSKGKTGVCRVIAAQDGEIRELYPHRWSTYGLAHIESIPFYHVYPGSQSMVIGTLGCNFDCSYCSNAYVAKEEPALLADRFFHLQPDKLVDIARKIGCHNIVFNVNEPTVSLPTLVELSRAARQAGMPLGCLTNGYMTEEATATMAEIFSFINISLKSITDEFYRHHAGVKGVEPILRNIRSLARTTHLELLTPIIQSVNDGEIDAIADFIASVDPEIPWHVFRLLPEYKMKEVDYPLVEEINARLETARQKLPDIYFHNFVGSLWVNTFCPRCGTTVIERLSLGCGGDRLLNYLCPGEICPSCQNPIRILGQRTEWNSREVG